VTYLLGVGDRHLDNLLLSPDGRFFHGELKRKKSRWCGPLLLSLTRLSLRTLAVDFGYILGRDPKPFPPAVKVCKEMVDAMGGMQSPHYARFKSLCYTGFTTLRKNANLLINLVALMVDGNIPDIKLEPDKAVMKVRAWRGSRPGPFAEEISYHVIPCRSRTSSFSPCPRRKRSRSLRLC
jgi:phosphatidylinositol 3-kinase